MSKSKYFFVLIILIFLNSSFVYGQLKDPMDLKTFKGEWYTINFPKNWAERGGPGELLYEIMGEFKSDEFKDKIKYFYNTDMNFTTPFCIAVVEVVLPRKIKKKPIEDLIAEMFERTVEEVRSSKREFNGKDFFINRDRMYYTVNIDFAITKHNEVLYLIISALNDKDREILNNTYSLMGFNTFNPGFFYGIWHGFRLPFVFVLEWFFQSEFGYCNA